MSATDTEYLSSLTALRGIAALWVVLFHIDVSIFYRDLGSLIPASYSGVIASGYLWVDFFFILSGFIMTHVYGASFQRSADKERISAYIWARFRRIYPLHLFTLLLLVGLSQLGAQYAPFLIDSSWHSYFSFDALPSNLLLTNSMNQHVYLSWNIVSWSIGAEWWTYFLGIGLLVAIPKQSSTITIIIALASFILLTALYYIHPGKNLDITFDYGFFRCLFEFTLGVCLHNLYRANTARKWFQHDGLFLLLALAIFSIFHWQLNDLLAIPSMALLILATAYNKTAVLQLLSKPLPQFLGKISYSIYLMHGVWFMIFWFALPVVKSNLDLETFSLLQKLIYLSLFYCLTIISAAFTYRFIEVPSRRLLTRKRALQTS